MEKTTYTSKEIEIVSIVKKVGSFKPDEDSKPINFTTYKVRFKHKDNPLVFEAKVDKVFSEYMMDILKDADAAADSGEQASAFWS